MRLLISVQQHHPLVTKIIFVASDKIKVKTNNQVILLDFSNRIPGIDYIHSNDPIHLNQILMYISDNEYTKDSVVIQMRYPNARTHSIPEIGDFTLPHVYYYFEEAGETETDEEADYTVFFPEKETRWEWARRQRVRLTLKAREFVDGIDSGWVDLKSKSRNLAGDTLPHHTVSPVEPNVMNVRAYDNVSNWMRSLIGYAWQQIAAVIDGGDDAPTREEVEALIDDVTANLIHKEMVEDFFHDHDVEAWWLQHQDRKVVLANHDEGFTPNTDAVIHDINENHRTMPVPGSPDRFEINHTTAEQEFHECVTTDFDNAWKSKNRTMITERRVTIPDPLLNSEEE